MKNPKENGFRSNMKQLRKRALNRASRLTLSPLSSLSRNRNVSGETISLVATHDTSGTHETHAGSGGTVSGKEMSSGTSGCGTVGDDCEESIEESIDLSSVHLDPKALKRSLKAKLSYEEKEHTESESQADEVSSSNIHDSDDDLDAAYEIIEPSSEPCVTVVNRSSRRRGGANKTRQTRPGDINPYRTFSN